MIAPLTAFSTVYTARAQPPGAQLGALPPVSTQSPDAVSKDPHTAEQSSRTPAQAQTQAQNQAQAKAPALTGGGRALAENSLLLAVQESRKAAKGGPTDLTKEEQKLVGELKKRDQEVRRHERAHSSAAGSYGGLPSYDLQKGPDGRMYAVGGEVSIDVKPLKDPAATIAKEEIVIRAALAPADPSAQDHAIAAQARQLKAEAVADLNREKEAEKAKTRELNQEAGLSGPTDAAKATRAARAAYAYDKAAGNAASANPASGVIDTVNGQGISLSA